MGNLLGSIKPGGSGTAFGDLGNAAGQLGKTGGTLTGMGVPQLQQAGGYFSSLAGGNRSQMTQTLAPDIENTNAVYGGTARTLGRFLRGPQKDVQLAETERERGGAIGSLFRNGRMQANTALAGLGASNVGAGTGATASSGSLFGSQANLGQQADIESARNAGAAGVGFGSILFNLLKAYGAKGGA